MAEALDTRTGRCRCGAVRFRAESKPLWVAHCHCDDCRRATSSPMTTYAGFARERFAFTSGLPASYNSSPGVTRTFCSTCGSPLTYEGVRWPDEIHVFVPAFDDPAAFTPRAHVYYEGVRWPDEIHVFVPAFDDPAAFTPRAHVYVAQQLPWLHLNDGLRRFATTESEGPPLP